MSKEEIIKEAQKLESFDKVHTDNKETLYNALKRIKELELELIVEKDQHQEEINLHLHAEDYIKSLEKENEELRNNGFTASAMTEQQLKVAIGKGKQLEKENKKVKQGCHKWFMRWRKVKREELEEISKIEELEKENDKLNDLVDMYNYFYSQAKELLAKWVELFKPKSETVLPTPIQVDTEQFLKDSEVEKC